MTRAELRTLLETTIAQLDTFECGPSARADMISDLREAAADLAPLSPPYRCTNCGGTNVSHAMWVDLNTDAVTDPFGEWCEYDTAACADCPGEAIRIVGLDDGDEYAEAAALATRGDGE